MTVTTAAATTTNAATDPPTMASIRRRRACCARRSSCRSSLRLAVARRCSLVGTANIPPWLWADQQRVCQSMLRRGGATHARSGNGKLEIMFITGFPAGLLQCNCYVLAPHPGADAIVIDPGQRAMGPLRRILDENRLTPAAVLLTHGHIDHIWSAQKVADTYGCPAYIHPEDRFMLTDPIKDFGPRLGQLLLAAMFREPKQVIELDRDGDKIDLGGISVTVDHTPGHTRGSVVFRVADAGDDKDDKDLVFTGDTLFE